MFLRSFRAQTYQLAKTPILYLNFLWPIVLVILFSTYYVFAHWSNAQKLTGFFEGLSLIVVAGNCLLCTYVVQQEEKAGNFFNLLCIGASRLQILWAWLYLLVSLLLSSCIIAIVGFASWYGNMPAITYVLTSILLLLPLTSLVLIQMFVALQWGAAWSMGVGAINLLIGALGVTGLFDGMWYYFPPTWSARLSSLMIEDYLHPHLNVAIAAEIRYGLLWCILTTAALAILVSRWFNRWDGRTADLDD